MTHREQLVLVKRAADLGRLIPAMRKLPWQELEKAPFASRYIQARHILGNGNNALLNVLAQVRNRSPESAPAVMKSVARHVAKTQLYPGFRGDQGMLRLYGLGSEGHLPGQQWNFGKTAGTHNPVTGFPRRPTPAMGIPDRNDMGDLSKLKEGELLDYFIQYHLARRAGPHFDLRAGTPETGLYSWATKKPVPKPGDRPIAVYRQPLHAHAYGPFEGILGPGYGHGTVKLHDQGKLLITRLSPQAIHFTTANDQNPKRYVLLKTGNDEKRWMLMATKPLAAPGGEKAHYKSLEPDEAEALLSHLQNATVSPKLDGAMTYLRLDKHRAELMSHRTSARTGQGIAYTEKFFGRNPEVAYPKKFNKALLMGELYGERQGKAVPVQELGGILNATIANSLQKQKDQGVDLKTMLYGLRELKGKPVDLPAGEQRRLLRELLPFLPKGKFTLPEYAETPDKAQDLFARVRAGQHPLTQEGVVINPNEGPPLKSKFRPEQDVYIRGFTPGEGKYKGRGVGAVQYSMKPESPILGQFGTGISDELREEFFKHPELYQGRVARLTSHGAFPSGALRVPVMLGLHEDYPRVGTS